MYYRLICSHTQFAEIIVGKIDDGNMLPTLPVFTSILLVIQIDVRPILDKETKIQKNVNFNKKCLCV